VTRYLARRVGFLLLTLLLTSIVIFAITQLLPGDVARVILGREASEAALQALRTRLGLDRPAAGPVPRVAGGLRPRRLGPVVQHRRPDPRLVLERLGHSLMLAGLTLALAVPLAVALGVLAALRAGTWLDGLISVGSLAVVGLPEFVTGLVLIDVFAFRLGWLPANASIAPEAGFLEALPMLILPALTATLVLLAYIARLTRASVIEELRRPYVRTATLKGLPRRTVIVRHVLRNALLPTITVVAISIGWLISGLIVVENVFNYPGLGRLLTFAIDRRDVPLLQAISLVAVVAFALANLARRPGVRLPQPADPAGVTARRARGRRARGGQAAPTSPPAPPVAARSASPTKFSAATVRVMASPGNTASQGDWR
jgi:peptide/nickel transport system permease protein